MKFTKEGSSTTQQTIEKSSSSHYSSTTIQIDWRANNNTKGKNQQHFLRLKKNKRSYNEEGLSLMKRATNRWTRSIRRHLDRETVTHVEYGLADRSFTLQQGRSMNRPCAYELCIEELCNAHARQGRSDSALSQATSAQISIPTSCKPNNFVVAARASPPATQVLNSSTPTNGGPM